MNLRQSLVSFPDPREDRDFAFTSDLATLVANQLERFVTLGPEQLAGHVANLDFWLEQSRNALRAVDGYGIRFIQMEGAQRIHASRLGREPEKLRRVPDRALREPRRALVASCKRFLTRCRAEGLLTESRQADAMQFLGIAVQTEET